MCTPDSHINTDVLQKLVTAKKETSLRHLDNTGENVCTYLEWKKRQRDKTHVADDNA